MHIFLKKYLVHQRVLQHCCDMVRFQDAEYL